MGNGGRRNVGGRCRTGCRNVRRRTASDGNVGGGGSAGYGDVGRCDGNVGRLGSTLNPATRGGTGVVVGEVGGLLWFGGGEVLVRLVEVRVLIP